MKQLLLLIITVLVTSCINQDDNRKATELPGKLTDDISEKYIDTLRQLEHQSTIFDYDSLGQIISTIRFDVKTSNLTDYEDGKIPWIRIDSPNVDIQNLIGKDEVVINESKLIVIIDYPLSTNYKFELTSSKGFTREQLINEISNHYYHLYEEEEGTATIKTIPLKDRKIYNRNQTNGRYGIWGHDIGDLVLNEIHVYKNQSGQVHLVLQLES